MVSEVAGCGVEVDVLLFLLLPSLLLSNSVSPRGECAQFLPEVSARKKKRESIIVPTQACCPCLD